MALPAEEQGKEMPQYLLAIHHPVDFVHPKDDGAMDRDIDALNEEMGAKGMIVFMGGMKPPKKSRTVRPGPGGKTVVTDGPYVESKEHIGGFWIIEAANMDEAQEWGRKGSLACRAPVEVRQFIEIGPDGPIFDED
jgi:hypothetical protein